MKTTPRWSELADRAMLVLLGGAMIVVAATGDSLQYVREAMTLPLILAGAVVVMLGLAGLRGGGGHRHTPRSFGLVGIAIAFLLVVRPGPLSVAAGVTYDPAVQSRVQQFFEIPREAVVGENASAADIEANALGLHAGELWYASQQLPESFAGVAVRMLGQFDPNDGDPQLVRFRITCCAADALRLVTPLSGELDGLAEGEWIEVFGQWDGDTTTPGLDLASWHVVETPDHPYLTIRDA